MGMRDEKDGKAAGQAGGGAESKIKNMVVLMPVDYVKPYGGNPKLHDAEQVKKLARQIREHGFDQPIVVDRDKVIIKGHGRHLAAKELGLKMVPVIVRDDLTDEQARAARIADNKLAETGWNWELLTDEIDGLMAGGFDLSLTAFDEDELKKILKDTGATPLPGGGEVDADGMSMKHKCPRCGFEFDD